jgi:formyltetrahydrofolate deformylase
MSTAHTARLLITCADRPGIVQAVSSFLYHHGANITALDQYATETQGGTYFMRVEFALERLQDSRDVIMRAFGRNCRDAVSNDMADVDGQPCQKNGHLGVEV